MYMMIEFPKYKDMSVQSSITFQDISPDDASLEIERYKMRAEKYEFPIIIRYFPK